MGRPPHLLQCEGLFFYLPTKSEMTITTSITQFTTRVSIANDICRLLEGATPGSIIRPSKEHRQLTSSPRNVAVNCFA